MLKNKKGFMIELIVVVVIGFISILFFGGIIYGFGKLNTQFNSLSVDMPGMNNTEVNITKAAANSFGYLNTGLSGLKLVSFALFISYIIGTFIFAYLSTRHPLWLFVYFLITLLVIIFSVYVSNAYETVSNSDALGTTLKSFTIIDFMLLQLPYIITLVGFIGIIFSIVGIVAVRRIYE